MGGILRTPGDAAFSLCVRERAAWKCEKCGAQHLEKSMGLHCSHHAGFSRGNWATRFHPWAAEALCYGCHSHYGGTPDRNREVMTDAQEELLRERRDDRSLARMYRKTRGKGEIAKHYREEYSRMRELRKDGETGRIEFEEWL